MSQSGNKNKANSKTLIVITYVYSFLIPITLIIFSIVFAYRIEKSEVILTFIICGTISFIVSIICNLILKIKYLQMNKKNEFNSYDKALMNVINKFCGGKENE